MSEHRYAWIAGLLLGAMVICAVGAAIQIFYVSRQPPVIPAGPWHQIDKPGDTQDLYRCRDDETGYWIYLHATGVTAVPIREASR